MNNCSTSTLYKWTPLIFAAKNGSKEIVESLLAKKAILDNKDDDGETALMKAVMQGHIEIVKVLLSHGANPKIKNNDGDTAINIAENLGLPKIAELLEPSQ